jgi:hypothetical protein
MNVVLQGNCSVLFIPVYVCALQILFTLCIIHGNVKYTGRCTDTDRLTDGHIFDNNEA